MAGHGKSTEEKRKEEKIQNKSENVKVHFSPFLFDSVVLHGKINQSDYLLDHRRNFFEEEGKLQH